MASYGEVPTENPLLAEFKAKKELRHCALEERRFAPSPP